MRDLFFRFDNAWLAQDCRERLKTAAFAGVLALGALGGIITLLVAIAG